MNNKNKNKITLDTGANSHYYPQQKTSVANFVTLPVIYSLEFWRAWKKIVDENNNKTKTKSNRNRRR